MLISVMPTANAKTTNHFLSRVNRSWRGSFNHLLRLFQELMTLSIKGDRMSKALEAVLITAAVGIVALPGPSKSLLHFSYVEVSCHLTHCSIGDCDGFTTASQRVHKKTVKVPKTYTFPDTHLFIIC